jgi:hypothetical protein
MAAINHKVRLPTPTEVAISDAILADGGAKFRGLQAKWFPKIKDAYDTKVSSGRRSHYGFSGAGGGLGERCERALWLRWRWQNRDKFAYVAPDATPRDRIKSAAMHRLVNRGHLEEARFLAMLEMIGVQVDDPTEGQERVALFNGHAGSALDAVLHNVPCAPGETVLGEFKTSNDKNFMSLVKDGCRVSKAAHYVQMQLCMAVRGIHKCLYMVVNKNNDELYTEMVDYNEPFATKEIALIEKIVFDNAPGAKISNDPTWFSCKSCDCHSICQTKTYTPERTCRGCVAGAPDTQSDGWRCMAAEGSPLIPKAFISQGCDKHRAFTF